MENQAWDVRPSSREEMVPLGVDRCQPSRNLQNNRYGRIGTGFVLVCLGCLEHEFILDENSRSFP